MPGRPEGSPQGGDRAGPSSRVLRKACLRGDISCVERSEPRTASVPRCRDSWQTRRPRRAEGKAESVYWAWHPGSARVLTAALRHPEGQVVTRGAQPGLSGGPARWAVPQGVSRALVRGRWTGGTLDGKASSPGREMDLSTPFPWKEQLDEQEVFPRGRVLPGSGAGYPPPKGALCCRGSAWSDGSHTVLTQRPAVLLPAARGRVNSG